MIISNNNDLHEKSSEHVKSNTYFKSLQLWVVSISRKHNLFLERMQLKTSSNQPHDLKTDKVSLLRLNIDYRKIVRIPKSIDKSKA